jgi:hypothetical protein
VRRGDDYGKESRRKLIEHDPKMDKMRRNENLLVLFLVLYLGGHVIYALFFTS